MISVQAQILWAKTDGSNNPLCYSPLWVHGLDAGEVTRCIWRDWLPDATRTAFIDWCGSCSVAEKVAVWLSLIHDIGKATPSFQSKVISLAEVDCEEGLSVPLRHLKSTSHASLGQTILERWLEGRGWQYPNTYAVVVGGHHGCPPDRGELDNIVHDAIPAEMIGGSEWLAVQKELLDAAWSYCGMDRYEELFSKTPLLPQLQVELTGIVIMADWIASNSDLFPLSASVSGPEECVTRAREAWEYLDLPSAWHPAQEFTEPNETFHDRFPSISTVASLTPTQLVTIEAARSATKPVMIILEAPMGSGKTEAALLASELLARKFGEGGVDYLLPTMATSNAMFTRVNDWIQRLPDERGDGQRQSIRLAHSKAELNESYAKLCTWGASTMGDEVSGNAGLRESVLAHQWFGGSKRALLSSFVVGTVDQLLMAVLKVRHYQLRHLGLAGRVVIVDEVHAYDAYMSRFLDRALEWLSVYGVPVILLSATLPPSRRAELIQAYRGRPPKSRRPDANRSLPRYDEEGTSYPLVSMAARGLDTPVKYLPCAVTSRSTNVLIEYLPDDDDALMSLLCQVMTAGGCVCILRDTVKRAQETYEMLKQVSGEDVMLVHSRFIAPDRMENDNRLLLQLGSDASKRPSRLIVVGTQVIEQSLDIDFDLMVSDIAPIDLLLQRMGRLHRHHRGDNESNRPEPLRQARLFLTGVADWSADIPTFSKGIPNVYDRALLLRTVLALRQHGEGRPVEIHLPGDIAPLVRKVYENEVSVPESWSEDMGKAEKNLASKEESKKINAEKHLLKGVPRWSTYDVSELASNSYSEDGEIDRGKGRAAVRDSQESIEVVVVVRGGGELLLLPWISGPDGSGAANRSLGDGSAVPRDDVARIAATCTVNLPPVLTRPDVIDSVIAQLASTGLFDGWQESRWLKGQLALVLDSNLQTKILIGEEEFTLDYSHEMGLRLFGKEID